MKDLVRTATSLLLLTLVIGLTIPTTSLPVAAQSAAADRQQDSGRIVPLKDRLPAGVLRGEAARQRVNKLRASSKALDRAMRDKERQGKRIDWEASATIIFAKPREKRASVLNDSIFMKASYTPAQETLSDGSGEATFITYDGDLSTWDGTIHRTDYYTGQSEVFNADMYDFGAADDPAAWDVTHEVYYPSDGGDPCTSGGGGDTRFYLYEDVQPCGVASAPQANEGTAGGRFVNASFAGATKAATARPAGSVFRWFSKFWRCYSRTVAYRGAVCISPQPSIRRNLICYISAGVYAAGCCARYAHNNSGQGICYQ